MLHNGSDEFSGQGKAMKDTANGGVDLACISRAITAGQFQQVVLAVPGGLSRLPQLHQQLTWPHRAPDFDHTLHGVSGCHGRSIGISLLR